MSLNLIVLVSPPGGGKGSLSKLLTESLGYIQLSTGNLCREHITKQTDIGKKIDFIIKSGNLISDSMISDMVSQWMSENLNSNCTVILDGYPRTVTQAESLSNILKNKFEKAKLSIVRLIVSESVVVNRLALRVICSNNKCQAVYSRDINSDFASKQEGICDKCNWLLIKRSDDNKDTVIERLSVYTENENELIDYYKKIKQRIIEINAEQKIDKIYNDFRKLVIN